MMTGAEGSLMSDMRRVIADLHRWTEEQRKFREQLMADLRAASTVTDKMRESFASQERIRAVSNMLASATESLRPFVEQMERDRQRVGDLEARLTPPEPSPPDTDDVPTRRGSTREH
jgi:DNA repair ATPase RecN